jgi:hypothetical protein
MEHSAGDHIEDPTVDPTSDHTEDPTVDPTSDHTEDPTGDHTEDPTGVKCDTDPIGGYTGEDAAGAHIVNSVGV